MRLRDNGLVISQISEIIAHLFQFLGLGDKSDIFYNIFLISKAN